MARRTQDKTPDVGRGVHMCSTPIGPRGSLFEGHICGGQLVLDGERFTTGPDTQWREQPVVLRDLHCERCGSRYGEDRRPTDEKRVRCWETWRRVQVEIAARLKRA